MCARHGRSMPHRRASPPPLFVSPCLHLVVYPRGPAGPRFLSLFVTCIRIIDRCCLREQAARVCRLAGNVVGEVQAAGASAFTCVPTTATAQLGHAHMQTACEASRGEKQNLRPHDRTMPNKSSSSVTVLLGAAASNPGALLLLAASPAGAAAAAGAAVASAVAASIAAIASSVPSSLRTEQPHQDQQKGAGSSRASAVPPTHSSDATVTSSWPEEPNSSSVSPCLFCSSGAQSHAVTTR